MKPVTPVRSMRNVGLRFFLSRLLPLIALSTLLLLPGCKQQEPPPADTIDLITLNPGDKLSRNLGVDLRTYPMRCDKSVDDTIRNACTVKRESWLTEEKRLTEIMKIPEQHDQVLNQLGCIYHAFGAEAYKEEDRQKILGLSKTVFKKALEANADNPKGYTGLLLQDTETDPKYVAEQFQYMTSNFKEFGYESKPVFPPEKQYSFLISRVMELPIFCNSTRGMQLAAEGVRRFPKSQRLAISKAQIHWNLLEFDQAAELAKKVMAMDQTGQEALAHEAASILALINQEEGHYQKAIEYFKKAEYTRDGKVWACAYMGLGNLYQRIGRPSKGAEMAMKVADQYVQNPNSSFVAARRCFETFDFDNGMEYIDRSLKLDPKDPRYILLKGFLWLMQKDITKARKQFDKLDQSDFFGQVAAGVGFGHLAITEQDYSEAEKYLKPLTEKLNRIPWFYFEMACLGMGWINANQGRHTQALHYFDQVLSQNTANLFGLLGRGNSLIGLQRLKEARKAFDKVLEIQPDNQYALAEMGIIDLHEGNETGAEESFQRALSEENQKYTCPYEGLGMLYMKQGKVEEAKKSFEKAIAINPDIEYKKFNELAKINIREGNYPRARLLLKKSNENYPYDEEAKTLLTRLEQDADALRKELGGK